MNPLNSNTFSLCLNMIVKNEEKNIHKCLSNLVKYFDFDFITICDTGSTDNTTDIVQNFFIEHDICGQIIHHKWVNFAHNRTLALQEVFNKSDYVLIFDADDIIEGQLILPDVMVCDKYSLKFGNDFFYYRPCLVNNRLQWEYIGILHEYLSLKSEEKKQIISGNIDGNYYIKFGTHGCRSQDPNKYINDAILLENSSIDPSITDNNLKNRYTFYCANSYYDAGHFERALIHYKKVIDSENWNQEKFYSCMRIGHIYMNSNNSNSAVEYWTKSFTFDCERIETIILLMKHFYNKSNHFMVNTFFHKFLHISSITNEFNNIDKCNKLFCNYSELYLIHYYNSISAFYVKDYKNGYDSCLYLINNDKFTSLSIDNLQFYINVL